MVFIVGGGDGYLVRGFSCYFLISCLVLKGPFHSHGASSVSNENFGQELFWNFRIYAFISVWQGGKTNGCL